MKTLPLLFLVLFAASCGQLTVYAPARECASQVTYIGEGYDFRELYYWTDDACDVFHEEFGLDSVALLGELDSIVVNVVDEETQVYMCGIENSIACAYSYGVIWMRDGNRHGPGRVMRHEVLHLLMWRAGINGDLHHEIMKEHGWY